MHSSRKHILSLSIASVAVVSLLAACGSGGSNGSEGNGSSDTDSASDDVEIRFAWWGSGERNELTYGVIDLFEAANPDVTVSGEPTDFGAHWERLTVQGASGGAPCVPQQQSRHVADYATRNQLLDLGPFIEDGAIDVSGIPERVLGTGVVDDTQYMIPYGTFYAASIYNETILTDNNAPLPPSEWTWDEWMDWVYEVDAALPDDMYVLDMYNAVERDMVDAWVVGNGETLYEGAEIGFQQETLINWWEMWLGFIEDGISTTPQMYGERGNTIEEVPMTHGEIVWAVVPDNQLNQYNSGTSQLGTGEIRMDRIPSGPGGSGEILGASGLSISSSCTDEASIDAATRFIDFFVNDADAAELFASNNGTVTVTAFQDAQIEAEGTSEYVRRQVELARDITTDEGVTTYVLPVGGRQVNDAFTRISTSVLLGETSPEDGAEAFISEANAALAAGGAN